MGIFQPAMFVYQRVPFLKIFLTTFWDVSTSVAHDLIKAATSTAAGPATDDAAANAKSVSWMGFFETLPKMGCFCDSQEGGKCVGKIITKYHWHTVSWYMTCTCWFRYVYLRSFSRIHLLWLVSGIRTQPWYCCCFFFSDKSKAHFFAACLVLSHFAIISGVNSSTEISQLMASLAGPYPQYLGSTHNSRCRKCTSSNCNSSCVLAVISDLLVRLRIVSFFFDFHPGRLTWNIIIEVWFRSFSYKNMGDLYGSMLIFQGVGQFW